MAKDKATDPAEPAGDATPSEPTERTITLTQAEFDKKVQERVARAEKKYSDYDDLKVKASEFDKYQESQKSELEKQQARAAKAEESAHAAQLAAQEAMFRSAVVAEAARKKVVDPDAAVALIDRSAITFDDTGVPSGVSEALDRLVGEKTYLVGNTRLPSADQGARSDNKAGQVSRDQLSNMTPDQIVKAQNEGLLKDVLAG